MPNYLPFKVAVIGFPFSGKKAISELLSKKYNAELITVQNVVSELLEYYKRWCDRERSKINLSTHIRQNNSSLVSQQAAGV
jgi:dephospho-CoA kinase